MALVPAGAGRLWARRHKSEAWKADEPACTPGFSGRLYGLSGYPAGSAENVGILRLVGVGGFGDRRRVVGLLRTIRGPDADSAESGLDLFGPGRGAVTKYLGQWPFGQDQPEDSHHRQ